MEKILIIDDDSSQLNYFSTMLEPEFKIEISNNLLCATEVFKTTNFDAVISKDLEFIDSIKLTKFSQKPALFILQSESSSENKMRALRLGVNDFLCAKMSQEEIILRIRNQLFHKNTSITHSLKSYKDIEMNLLTMNVTQSNKKLELTLLEYKLLSYFIGHQQRIVTRKDLKEFAWPNTSVQDKTVNTHISNLRSKLDTKLLEIKAIKGKGFVLI